MLDSTLFQLKTDLSFLKNNVHETELHYHIYYHLTLRDFEIIYKKKSLCIIYFKDLRIWISNPE